VEEVRAVAPQTDTESALAGIWADLLQRPILSVEESFFSLGGHSLMAVRLFDRIRRRFGADLAISALFSHPTIRDLAELVDGTTAGSAGLANGADPSADWDTTTIIHAGPGNGATPLFIVGGVGGNVNNLVDLGTALGQHRKVVGIQTRGILGHTPCDTIEEMAADNIRHIRRHQPVGPYVLAGYSGGAQTAFEMARQLAAAGEQVAEVVLLDTFAPGVMSCSPGADTLAVPVQLSPGERLVDEIRLLVDHGLGYVGERLSAKFANRVLRGRMLELVAVVSPTVARSRRSALAWFAAARKYRGGAYAGRVSLVVSQAMGLREERFIAQSPYLGWNNLIDPANITRVKIDCRHLEMVRGRHAAALTNFIEGRISAALEGK
jgi:thioesterase domain-containing protein/acyl carrier protein